MAAKKLTDAKLGKLARKVVIETDPWIESLHGNVSCFYCMRDEYEEHDDDCLFVVCGGSKQSFHMCARSKSPANRVLGGMESVLREAFPNIKIYRT